MRILGIDPGTLNLGYGVVDGGADMQMVAYGVLSLPRRLPMEERLKHLYAELSQIILRHQPNEAAIEEPFVGRNVRSALAVGRAQAVAVLAAANHGLPVAYYPPATVKLQTTSYGQSDKRQVQEMVRIQLGLHQIPESFDAADALAVAICHLQRSLLTQRLAEQMRE